jgi:hypothetical protein
VQVKPAIRPSRILSEGAEYGSLFAYQGLIESQGKIRVNLQAELVRLNFFFSCFAPTGGDRTVKPSGLRGELDILWILKYIYIVGYPTMEEQHGCSQRI